jgi:hypothetical protein
MGLKSLLKLPKIKPPKLDQRSDHVPDGDMVMPRQKGQKVEPKELRELCELIRQRYSLDVEIWSLRRTLHTNRKAVEDKMRQSDAILKKINRIVDFWDSEDAFPNAIDRAKFQAIKESIKLDGKRNWAKDSPFD